MTGAYAKSGVDVDVEAKASRMLYEAAKKTFANRKKKAGEIVSVFDDFSGLRAVNIGAFPKDTFMCMGFDTVGTKSEIAQRMGKHDTIAYDLFAMVCDDAVLRGGEPILIGSNLDINTLGTDDSKLQIIKQLAQGYVEAAKEADVAVINGELCQLGKAVGGYGDFVYNWGAALIWIARKKKLFTGMEIKQGDYIIALEEKGFRSNGISLVRKVFSEKLGEDWHDVMFEGKKLGLHVLEPSRIYTRAIMKMHGRFDEDGICEVHGIVHVTGGGLPEKLGRVLRPSGLGAVLTNIFEPCPAMRHCMKLGRVDEKEAYRTWNMGQGMLVISPQPTQVIAEATKCGIRAKLAGKVVKEKKIMIRDLEFDL